MKERTQFRLSVAGLALAACISMAGIHYHCSQFVQVDALRYELSITQLDLSGSPVTDLDSILRFPNLEQLDLRGTGLTVTEYEFLRSQLPNCEILWELPFQGSFYPLDTESITISSLSDEDLKLLDYLPQLKTVRCEQCPDYARLDQLRQRRPELELNYTIPVAGRNYRYDTTSLTLFGMDAEELSRLLSYFPEMQSVKLLPPLSDSAQLLALREAHPDVDISWQLVFKDIRLDDTATTLDLTGIPTTVEEMEELIPYLPNLTYVDMTDCGISNEEMDALNRRHENVKIVWTVDVGRWFRVKTDITWFMPVKYGAYISGNDMDNLRYCTDIIALDIGHMYIYDCEWAAYMPHLKYLLIGDTKISDLTPISGLQELVYLEFFMTPVTDYSPLLTLPALEDVNMHYTQGDPEIIAQLTWLKNCWWGHVEGRRCNREQQQMLREAIPGCHFNFTSYSSTGEGWRELPNYYAQRDILGMWYMTG